MTVSVTTDVFRWEQPQVANIQLDLNAARAVYFLCDAAAHVGASSV